jgi:hypothetical protein
VNHAKRRGLTLEGRERLRQAALTGRPWLFATGPRTPEGKARAAANGKIRQKGERSVREVRNFLAEVTGLRGDMVKVRDLVADLLAAKG